MHLRPAARSDLATLEGLLLEAVNWCPDRPQLTLEELNGNDMLVRYVEEWPRADDVGVIAEDDDVSWEPPGSDGSLRTDQGSASSMS